MKGDVQWSALVFLAGVIVASVVWTYLLVNIIDGRIDARIAVHEAIYHKH